MTHLRTSVRIAATIATVIVAVMAMTATGSTQESARLDLVSQTTFVTSEPVTITVRIPNRRAGQQIRVRVDSPASSEQELRASFVNPPESAAVADYSETNLEDLIVSGNDIAAIILPDADIGELLRRRTGALPIRLDLINPNGSIADTLVTAVIVDDSRESARLDVGFVSDPAIPLAHGLDSAPTIDPDQIVQRVADIVTDAPGPVLVSLAPETISALADPSTEGGSAAIDEIARLLQDHQLALSPWVTLDEQAWIDAGESDRVRSLYALGQQTVEEFLAITPTPIVFVDGDANTETVSFLRSVGVRGGLIEPAQVDSLSLDRADGRPIEVLDSNGVAMPTLVVDRSLETTMSGDDPELAAQQRFAELVLRSRTVGTDRAVIVDLGEVDRVALASLADLIATTDRVGIASVGDLLDGPLARDASGAILRVELEAAESSDVRGAASDLRLTESVLASYASMVAPSDDAVAPLRTLINAAPSDYLSPEHRQRYTDTVFNSVFEWANDFEVIDSSRITLAARQATLPVTIRSDRPVPVQAILGVSSEKLRFPDGDQLEVVLRPGVHEIGVPVETVASGDSRIQITVTSPDGGLNLATGSLNVRSTTVSGLGLIVSLVSGAILMTWWARTIVRVRRVRRASVSNASEFDPDQPDQA